MGDRTVLYLLKFQPQTKEHLAAIDLMGLKHIIVLQNKIDLIPREKAQVNFREIKKFVQGTPAGKRISILNFNQNLFYHYHLPPDAPTAWIHPSENLYPPFFSLPF